MLFIWACKPSVKTPPRLFITNIDTSLHQTDNGWFYKGQPFNGYMVERGRDGKILYQLPIIDGREEGAAPAIYETGEKLLLRHYKNGLKEGRFEQWWPNGHYRYLFNYTADKWNGCQLVFYPNGQKRQESNFLNGQLEGIQRTWNAKGELTSNYTVKDGKVYGLITVKSCLPHGH
jgi:antitoxin component YwqK of YwqJK toxin-antitoxin module